MILHEMAFKVANNSGNLAENSAEEPVSEGFRNLSCKPFFKAQRERLADCTNLKTNGNLEEYRRLCLHDGTYLERLRIKLALKPLVVVLDLPKKPIPAKDGGTDAVSPSVTVT